MKLIELKPIFPYGSKVYCFPGSHLASSIIKPILAHSPLESSDFPFTK